ncbi:hypothetical protein [Phytohabitans rumicis]|uniref:Uncharacterized protein n=1 Tax=Phytohabitans rumicis TaxID=1076125 RepID=A0A6V8LI44_9ACTN|nr:hypothetical protein [Phytohabitans rumicis]GFJ95854.1 hypothetical protein Prum_094960 [Phytohabitans rumicis]
MAFPAAGAAAEPACSRRAQAQDHLLGVEVAAQQVLDPFQDVVTGHDAGHEQDELAPDAQVDAGTLAAQPLGTAAGLGEVVEDLPRRYVTEGRLEPHVQPSAPYAGSSTAPPTAAAMPRKSPRLIPIRSSSM